MSRAANSSLLLLQDCPDASTLWNRWTGEDPVPMRAFWPDVNIPTKRWAMFMRFELSAKLVTADEPSEQWIAMFDRLLTKAFEHFGVDPSDEAVEEWILVDVRAIVKEIAAHPASKNLHKFSAIADKLVELENAFPDIHRHHRLKTFLAAIAESVKSAPKPELKSSDAAAANAKLFHLAGSGYEDPDLLELWKDYMSMELTSDVIENALHVGAPLTLPTGVEKTASDGHTTDHEGGTDEASSPRQRAKPTADRSRSPRQRHESASRPHSPLASIASSGGSSARRTHVSQVSKEWTEPGIRTIPELVTEVKYLKEQIAVHTENFERE
ncbi:hypothetical protein L227DRAFT_617482, partial [Lentinus tigrinus ALCF2SS1-6]